MPCILLCALRNGFPIGLPSSYRFNIRVSKKVAALWLNDQLMDGPTLLSRVMLLARLKTLQGMFVQDWPLPKLEISFLSIKVMLLSEQILNFRALTVHESMWVHVHILWSSTAQTCDWNSSNYWVSSSLCVIKSDLLLPRDQCYWSKPLRKSD